MQEKTTPKVRVYQAQSRLVGLHASCVFIMGRIAGAVAPCFKLTIPKGTAEALRLSFCELCHFRNIPEHSFVALYNSTRVMLKERLMLAEDRVTLQAQFEVMEYVRKERIEAKLAEGHKRNLPCVGPDGCGGTLETGHQRLCLHDPEITELTPSLRKRATEIATAMRPTPPPIRPTSRVTKVTTTQDANGTRTVAEFARTPKPVRPTAKPIPPALREIARMSARLQAKPVRRARPSDPKSVPRGLVGPGGTVNTERRGPAPRGETLGKMFDDIEEALRVKRKKSTGPGSETGKTVTLAGGRTFKQLRATPAPAGTIPLTPPRGIVPVGCTDPKCLKHGVSPVKGFRCSEDARK